MNPLRSLAGAIGVHRVGRTILATALALLLIGGGLVALALSPQGSEWLPGFQSPTPRVVVADDRDLDGLPDAVENRIGSDPDNFATLGDGVPDGWLHHWYQGDIDWSAATLLSAKALVPPQNLLPVPLQAPGALALPSLQELFAFDAAHFDPDSDRGAWWLVESAALDPRSWDNDDDGIADAWLVSRGLRPGEHTADDPAPGDATMTLGQKYNAGLDPASPDSDRDGLTDREEFDGAARIAGRSRAFAPTNPLLFSSRDDGIGDGYLVRFGLDPSDATLGIRFPAGDGVTVEEAFRITADHCGDACDWRDRLDNGPVLDPTVWDSLGDGVADAWALRDPAAIAHPLEDGRQNFPFTTASWDGAPWTGSATTLHGVVIDPDNPRPPPEAPYRLSLRDLYQYQRPGNWDEATQGPWWGGLDTVIEAPDGALPPAVALRGWNLTVETALGRLPEVNVTAEDQAILRAVANPRSGDTDGDGATDLQEYFGINAAGIRVDRTSPSDPDTDGDGLTDLEETGSEGLGTSPRRRDTAGDFLTDGEAFTYWNAAYDAAIALLDQDGQAAADKYGFLAGEEPFSVNHLDALLPGGTIAGNSSNILSPDADGDGLRNGQELYPNRFSPAPSAFVRPATDPSTPDTDGDGLPDAWEVLWSKDQYYGCSGGCTGPAISGWPLDPTKRNSFEAGSVVLRSDADLNLAGDTVVIDHGNRREFRTAEAFLYDLHPFAADTSGDGFSDLFAIHWGIEAVPDWAIDAIGADNDDLGFASDAANRLNNRLRDRGGDSVRAVVIDPTTDEQPVTRATNLLGLFTNREKGTWELTGTTCNDALPGTGTRSEAAYLAHPDDDGESMPGRAGLQGCWHWRAHALADDIAAGTNPWSHDTDGDRLPDAWELLYAPDASPGATGLDFASTTTGSIAAGCDDPDRSVGLVSPASGFCLTYGQSYARGLNPTLGDTDGGGLADWYEIALGQDPLDAQDDHGGEDWDGDGLNNSREAQIGTSPLSADTDRDGLADGGDPEVENAGLCIHETGSTLMPNMDHRPGTGPLSRRALYEHYRDIGVILDRDTNLCPAGQVLAFAEGGLQNDGGILVGFNTDRTSWDTSGDGLPDGWVAYWTLQDNDFVGEPLADMSGNPDSDSLTTLEEYRSGRPVDWQEPRDGVWWGGSNPGASDTDGDVAWFKDAFDGLDGADLDLDNDGLVSNDPYPGVDAANVGIIGRDATGAFAVDYERLWTALAARSSAASNDRDGDLVPDFIDRARVTLTGVSLSNETLDKGGSAITVTGRVLTREPDGDDGVAVGGVTVRASLSDPIGTKRTVGAAITGSDGRFSMSITADASMAIAARSQPVDIDGQRIPANTALAIATNADDLSPGLNRLSLHVDANDPAWQAATFDGAGAANAFKEVRSSGFPLPGGGRLAALKLLPDGSGPDPDATVVTHAAEAIFNLTQDTGRDIRLTASAALTLDGPGIRVLQGDDITVTGSLRDQTGTALAGRTVDLVAKAAGTELASANTLVADDGTYTYTFDAGGWAAGAVTVTGTAILLPESDAFLQPPAPVDRVIQVTVDTVWSDLFWGSQRISAGAQQDLPEDADIHIRARLTNHLDQAVTNQAVSLVVTPAGDPSSTFISETTTTAADGTIDLFIEQTTPAPKSFLQLTLRQNGTGDGDEHEPASLFLRPRFATSLAIDAATLPVAAPGQVTGILMQGGRPTASTGPFEARHGDTVVRFAGTDNAGQFTFPTDSDRPTQRTWAVRFLGTENFLQPSPATPVTVTYTSATRIAVDDIFGLRDAAVAVSGNLTLPNGAPVSGAAITVAWADDPDEKANARTNAKGAFVAELPARVTAGRFDVQVAYGGNATLRPTAQSAESTVLVPVEITTTPGDLRMLPTGSSRGHLVTGRLADDRGSPLAGRILAVNLTDDSGASQTFEVVTDGSGAFDIGASHFDTDRHGLYDVHIAYAGNDRDAAIEDAVQAGVTHVIGVVIERAPDTLEPGRQVTLRGTLEASSPLLPAQTLSATVGHVRVGIGQAIPGASWGLAVKSPALPAGDYTLTVGAAETTPFVEVQADTVEVNVAAFVRASLSESLQNDGSRHITVRVLAVETGRPVADTAIILTRSDDLGNVRATYDLQTGPDGEARLTLGPGESGVMEIVSLVDPRLRLAESTTTRDTIDTRIDQGSPVDGWVIGAASLSLLLLVALVVAYGNWRTSHRRRIVLSFQQAYDLLSRTRTGTSRVIQDAYHRLLDEMMAAGYRPTDQETARDIADHATRAFRLPHGPMERFTLLFEAAAYSGSDLDATHRAEALGCLRDLADATATATAPRGEVPA